MPLFVLVYSVRHLNTEDHSLKIYILNQFTAPTIKQHKGHLKTGLLKYLMPLAVLSSLTSISGLR